MPATAIGKPPNMTISGTDAGNYIWCSPRDITADITPKPIIVDCDRQQQNV
jgi:hypothetical protein